MRYVKMLIASLIFIPLLYGCASTTGIKKITDEGKVVYNKPSTDEKSWVISGKVVDSATKKGISGATVEIKNADGGIGFYKLETDMSGKFELKDYIKNIRYNIDVSADGYIVYRSVDAVYSGDNVIMLDKSGRISGEINGSDNQPVANVEITLKSTEVTYSESGLSIPKYQKSVVTDEKGNYIIDDVKPDNYYIYFKREGYIPGNSSCYLNSGQAEKIDFTLYKSGRISGMTKISGLDAPASGINITLEELYTDYNTGKEYFNQISSTSSYVDGSYSFEGIMPGKFRLVYTHQGFENRKGDIFELNEGDNIELKKTNLVVRKPELQVYANRYVYAPGNEIMFNLKSLRLEKVKVRIYKVPVDVMLSNKKDPNQLKPQRDGLAVEQEWDESIKDFSPYEWRYQSLSITKPLPCGGYCLEVSSEGKLVDRKYFSISSIGVVVKRTRTSVFCYATNLITNEPVANAKVAIYDNTPIKKESVEESNGDNEYSGEEEYYGDGEEGYEDNSENYNPDTGRYNSAIYYGNAIQRMEDLPVKLLLQGATDQSGILKQALKSDAQLALVAVSPDGSYAFCSTGSPIQFNQEEEKYFIYTDRPVYRAGDTVSYKIIAKRNGKMFTPMTDQSISLKIVNTDFNEEALSETATLDEWGTVNGTFTLSDDCNLGMFQIKVGPDENNLYGRGQFYVEQYRKPEFKVTLTPARDYYTNSENMEFKVEAKYLFGAPLNGANITYRFYENKIVEDAGYWWERRRNNRDYNSRIMLEGDKTLDLSGTTSLKLFSGNYTYDRTITLEVTVVDKTNVSMTTRSTIRVGRGEYYIKINPDKEFYFANEKKPVSVKTLTLTEKPVNATFNIKVYRYIWKPWQMVYVHDDKPIFVKEVSTGDKGIINLELPGGFPAGGEYDIVAEGRDKNNNVIVASRLIWVYDEKGGTVTSRLNNLDLKLDRTDFNSDGKLTCLVKSRYLDSYVCLTVEGRDVYESKVVKLNGNLQIVTFDITKDYAPNVFISAVLQRNRALYTTTTSVNVDNRNMNLNLSMNTDKDKYKPGDKVKLVVKATDDNGQPVKADLSLAVVDEAIFQIREDFTPRMVDSFNTKISNWVMTNYSFPITLLAGAAKEDKIKVRDDFRDTALWLPQIFTDEKGLAEINFKVPDNLTTWRLTMRGHSKEGLMGEKRTQTLVTQELIARIGKPRFLVEGDNLQLIGVVTNNTADGLANIATTFKIDGAVVPPIDGGSMSLTSYGTGRIHYPLAVPMNRQKTSLLFSARVDSKINDALKFEIPIERRGSSYAITYNNMAMKDSMPAINVPFKVSDFEYAPEEITISVVPNAYQRLIEAAKSLSNYPYGCVEQTISKFLPLATVVALLKESGVEPTTIDKEINDKVSTGIMRVCSLQSQNGSWGWWGGQNNSPNLTAYAMHSIYLLKNMNYYVPELTISNGKSALRYLLDNGNFGPDEMSYLFYVYTLWNDWDMSLYNKISKKCETSYQLSNLINAAKLELGRKKIHEKERVELEKVVADYTAILLKGLKRDQYGIYWGTTSKAWDWSGNNVIVTSSVLSALSGSEKYNDIAMQIIASLLNRSTTDGWGNTKTSAFAILALGEYLKLHPVNTSDNGSVYFTANGKEIARFKISETKSTDIKPQTIRVKLKDLGITDNLKIETVTENTSLPIPYNIEVKGILTFKEQTIPFWKNEGSSITALSNGLSVNREIYKIKRVRDMSNNEYLVPVKVDDKSTITVGDELMVKLKFSAADTFKYVALEDYLPSGFEVTRPSAYTSFTTPMHSEVWDNRMVFFFEELNPNEVYEIAYIVRAELPGDFMMRATRAECMYAPEIQGWTKPIQLKVEYKKD